MKEKEKFMDLEEMMDAINKLNELDMEGSAFSRLYYPPNVLLSYAIKLERRLAVRWLCYPWM